MVTNNCDLLSPAEPCQAILQSPELRIILCDDNKLFLDNLKDKIATILSSLGIDANISAFECAETIPRDIFSACDIFFLDIDFNSGTYNGIDIAKKIHAEKPNSLIVFVTNYIVYAPEGYEVQAFRYLLKDDLDIKLKDYLLQGIERMKVLIDAVPISVSGVIRNIPIADILYLESHKHHAVFRVQQRGKPHIKSYQCYASLVDLEKQLSKKGFLRIQRSYLVNMRRIQRYQCSSVLLDNGTTLPASEKNYAEQKRKYLLWKGRQ